MAKWTHVVEMKFEIELVDPMRIGGAGGGLEIGGVDPNLVALKDPVNNRPYVPGSSLKGKLRSTLEKEHGRTSGREPCGCGKVSCPVCPVFGAHKNMRPECGASRLTVRDARFNEDYLRVWDQRAAAGMPLFELKTENTIDRKLGTAGNPRTQERVPAGATFQAAMVLKVFEGDDDGKMIANLMNALAILQRFDSLGAGGSRGSGHVAIRHFQQEKVTLASLTL
jgi:CRISPR-associated protein Csm3